MTTTYGKGATVHGRRVTAPRLPGYSGLTKKRKHKKKHHRRKHRR